MWPAFVVAFLGAIAAAVLLMPHSGGATKARAGGRVQPVSARVSKPMRITPADAERDVTEWHMRVGDQSAD